VIILYSSISAAEWVKSPKFYAGTVNNVLSLKNGDLLALAERSIFKKTNGDNNWTKVSETLQDGKVLFLDSTNNKIYAGFSGGLYCSTDKGDNWISVPDFNSLNITAITSTVSGTVFVATQTGLFRSENNGVSWIQILSNKINDIKFSEIYQTLFAASDISIYRSYDLGQNWGTLDIISTKRYPTTALGINSTGKILAGYPTTSGYELYESTNNGTSWKQITYSSLPRITNIRVINDQFYITAGCLYRYGGTASYPTVSSPSRITVWDVAISNFGEMIISTDKYGLLKKNNLTNDNTAIENWNVIGVVNPAVVIACIEDDNENIFVGGKDGLYVYNKQLGVWKISGFYGYEGYDIRGLSKLNNIIYASVYCRNYQYNSGSPLSGMYKTSNTGSTWISLYTPSGSDINGYSNPGKLINIDANTLIFYDATSNGTSSGVYKYQNGNVTKIWTNYLNDFEYDNSVLYAGTSSGLWKSTDKGNVWLPTTASIASNLPVADVFLDNVSNNIYIATNKGIYFSPKENISWKKVSDAISNSIYIKNNNVVAAFNKSINLSFNASNSWVPLFQLSTTVSGQFYFGKSKLYYFSSGDGLFEKESTPVVTPVLVSPAKDLSEASTNLSFECTTPENAEFYNFQISTDSTFTTNVLDSTNTGNKIQFNKLNFSQKYYWKVAAGNIFNTQQSSIWRFYTKNRELLVKNLSLKDVSDLQHLVTTDPVIQFQYFDTSNELQTGYEVEVSTDSTFTKADMWKPGPASGADTQIKYAGNPFIDGQSYWLRLRVKSNDYFSNWYTLKFRRNSKPSVPQFYSPKNDQVYTELDPLIYASKSLDKESDNLTYEIQISQDKEFSNIVCQKNGLIAVSDSIKWRQEIKLSENGHYYARIRAFDAYEYSSYSDVSSFYVNTVNENPNSFALSYPKTNGTVNTLRPVISWDKATDNDPKNIIKYKLFLDTPTPGVEVIDVDTNHTYTFNTDLKDNTKYFWKVVAYDNFGGTVENSGGYMAFYVNLKNDLPGSFSGLSPFNGQMVTVKRPKFIWGPSVDIDPAYSKTAAANKTAAGSKISTKSIQGSIINKYKFYLSTSADFTNVPGVEVDTTFYTVDKDLIENQTYFWKVEAADSNGGVTQTDTWKFWVNCKNEAPGQFQLVSPNKASQLSTLKPALVWNRSIDPDINDSIKYTVTYGKDLEHLSTVSGLLDTTFTFSESLSDNCTYWWKVTAGDLSGAQTDDSQQFISFTINTVNQQPNEFSLITPGDSSVEVTTSPYFYWEAKGDPDPQDIVKYEFFVNGQRIAIVDSNSFQIKVPLKDNSFNKWYVKAIDNHNAERVSKEMLFVVNTVLEPPNSFELISPLNSGGVGAESIKFIWHRAADNDPNDYATYEILVATDSLLHNIVYSKEVGKDTSVAPASELPNNNKYFWAIKAKDREGLVTRSAIGSFILGNYVSVENWMSEIPTEYSLKQNFPNPFNPSTVIRYALPYESRVRISVFNSLGQLVNELVDKIERSGNYEKTFNAVNLPSGIYIYSISVQSTDGKNNFSSVKKMMLVK
jgi:photosystem II stability/assembly factor-like uncharacterized protein